MTDEEQVCVRVGRELVRMVCDVTGRESRYGRRTLTFPGGSVEMILTNDPNLATLMELAMNDQYAVEVITPPSQVN